MAKLRGNKTLSGTWGQLWIDGELCAEMNKVEIKVSANRDDIQVDMDVDSKITGLKGELTLGFKKVYSRFVGILESWIDGEDKRCTIMTKLSDPDAVGKQEERYSVDNCWFNELPLVNYEKGAVIDEEVSGGFTPSDMKNLDKIA